MSISTICLHTGTLPIVVDMNFIPKLNSEEESELPPPLPPRESTPPPSLNEEPLAPALPPKPTKMLVHSYFC